jgi:beta-glucosidase
MKIRKIFNYFLFIFCVGIAYFLVISYISIHYNTPIGHEISDEETLHFPDGFLWGAGTAAYQVEGGNTGSNWWEFEQIPGVIKNGDRTTQAVNHYNLYEDDFDLMKEMNLNSYRFSIEWSRIEPEKGVFNDTEIEHYRSVLEALHKRGIEPMVTLWHFTIPVWFEQEGGWENKNASTYFSEYVEFVVQNLGDETNLWVTMNEPMAYITLGYMTAKWPPAKHDYAAVPIVFSHILDAHKKAYTVIHHLDKDAQVGIAEHSSYIVPAGKINPLENIVAGVMDFSWTQFLLDEAKNSLDFIGIHYYYKQTIRMSVIKDFFTKSSSDFEEGSLDRQYYPEGLYEILMRLKKYDKPVYITEIGVPDYHKVKRDQFMEDHTREMYYAIQNGVDVKGIYYWSLLDNFEWTEGYDAKFGLIAVDLTTQKRSIKNESWGYANIAKCNCVKNYNNN